MNSVRSGILLVNGTGLKPPEAHTGAQLVRFYARRDNKDRQDDACCP
ncbi:hypothetical protein [Sorangium sp. So ce1024]